MTKVVNYNSSYSKDFYKLYCNANNIYNNNSNAAAAGRKYISSLIGNNKVKLLIINNKIKGYILYFNYNKIRNNRKVYIDEIFIDKDYGSKNNYIDLIESLNRGKLFSKYNFAVINVEGNKRSESLKSSLNLTVDRELYEMKKDLPDKINTNYCNINNSDNNISFLRFKKGRDEIKRLEVQNSIFKNSKGHIDYRIEDILKEENQDYFIEDGCFFLIYKGIIAGYSQIILDDIGTKKPYIVNFGIVDNYRGIGLSKILLNYTFNFLIQKGYKEVFISVDSDNNRAYNLYKNSGFIICGKFSSYLYKFK